MTGVQAYFFGLAASCAILALIPSKREQEHEVPIWSILLALGSGAFVWAGLWGSSP